MKIDGSLYTAYAFSKPRATSEDSLYNEAGGNGAGGNASTRNIPTVAPTTSLSSSFANALWLTNIVVSLFVNSRMASMRAPRATELRSAPLLSQA